MSKSGNVIYTTGYPRSGTWWVTRLLSDLLDSPIKTLSPDNTTVTDFCQTGKGGYIIYKTHWMSHEWDMWSGEDKVVFIQRDPRDIAVSGAFYRGGIHLLTDIIESMVLTEAKERERRIYHQVGVYEEWVRGWLECPRSIMVQYEWLHAMPYLSLARVCSYVTGDSLEDIVIDSVTSVIDRQSFHRWAGKYPHSMRKGIVGDWQNHFKREHGELMTRHLGQLMKEQGYITDLDWWKELPK